MNSSLSQKIPKKIYDSHVHFMDRNMFLRLFNGHNLTEEEILQILEKRDYRPWTPVFNNETREYELKRKKSLIEIPPKNPVDLATKWVKDMDQKGCDKLVLFSDFNELEGVKQAVKAYPDRLAPYLSLNPLDPNAKSVLEDAISFGIKGIKLYPPLHYYHAYDDVVLPFYEMAEDHELSVTFHFGVSVGKTADIRFMNPADLSPIARDFPKINFLMAHFATGYLKELLFLMYHVDNVYAETSSSNVWMKYLPYTITLTDVFKKILEVKGPDYLVFGTDSSFFTRGWRKDIFDWQLHIANKLNLSQQDINKIFYQNAQKLMNL